MIRIPAPLRKRLRNAVLAAAGTAFDELVGATSAESDGGRKITPDERRAIVAAIAERAANAIRDGS